MSSPNAVRFFFASLRKLTKKEGEFKKKKKKNGHSITTTNAEATSKKSIVQGFYCYKESNEKEREKGK
jgi:hypothetical protein